MSVVPHRSDKPETQAAPPARQRAVNIATSMAERIAKLADKTATQTKSAPSTAVEASKTGLARPRRSGAKTCCRRSSAPAPSCKERTRPDRLKQDYATISSGCTNACSIRRSSTLFFKPTKEPVPLAGLTIRGNNREYRPRLPADAVQPCSNGRLPPSTTIFAADLRRLRRGQGPRAAARLTASLPRCRRHRVRRGTARRRDR